MAEEAPEVSEGGQSEGERSEAKGAAPMRPLAEVLAELRGIHPDAPFLALGQTIFWDEPVKAAVAMSDPARPFVAGVHDTDFFAKLPSGPRGVGRFRAVPHNDTTTRGLWSAAAEFSALFGSETVVTRDMLMASGVALDRLGSGAAGHAALDAATEAWGWRGIVSLDEAPPLTGEVPAPAVLPALEGTLGWAFDESMKSLPGASDALPRHLRARVAEESTAGSSLADVYARLVREMYALAAGEPVPLSVTRTSELLRFNAETCGRDRFSLPRLFIESATRPLAREFYDDALKGGGQYELARFGTGAIPFDLVVPGCGRGTIRLGTRGAAIMAREPFFLSFKRPIATLEEFAEAVERKFGPDCALIGKAVTLIGMLAAEFVFVFHEGASGYTDLSLRLHRRLCRELLWCQDLNPILRVDYETWDSLAAVERPLRLPEPLRTPFQATEIPAAEFAARWRTVGADERARRRHLGTLRRPVEILIQLESWEPGVWAGRLARYRELQAAGERFAAEGQALHGWRAQCYDRRRAVKAERAALERRMGEQFRAEIFGREPRPEAIAERERMQADLARLAKETEELHRELHASLRREAERARDPEAAAIREERRRIEGEGEAARLRYVRDAVVASEGLAHADARPAAWWLPLVSPDGAWFREMRRTATARLEPLRPPGPR